MLPFRRGFEKVAQVEPVPVIPVWLDQLWGSILSYKHGRLFWKWPDRGPFPVTVTVGKAQPNIVTAPQIRQVLLEMSADVAKERTRQLLPVHRQFVRKAARHPFHPCLIDTSGAEPRTLSHGKILAGARCLAKWLQPMIRDEPMVGVWLPAGLGSVLANVAIPLLGKTVVNLNYTAGAESVKSAARQCSLRHVITANRFLERMPLDLGPDVSLIAFEDALAGISEFRKRLAYLAVMLSPGWLLDRFYGLSAHRNTDLSTVIFSSGSTGEPKGVMLTHQNVAANIDAFINYVNYAPSDHVLGILPPFHSFGYTVTLWAVLMAGATAVYHADPRAAKEVGELCRTYGCTLMGATATFLRMYMRRCQPEDFKTMRLLVCGAEKLPPSLIEEFKAKFGVEPLEGYGCTELSPVVSVNVPDVTVNRVTQVGTKVGSVGHPLPGIAARVVDPDTHRPVPIGAEGLVIVTGANVMKGYLGREDLTRKALLAGWYNTGDLGRMDVGGFITLTGRMARFAKIAGEMVPLERLEDELHKLLGTNDRVLVVTSVPDKKRGERLVVLYLPLPGMSVAPLLKRLGETGMTNLWIPDDRDCYAVPELPVLGSGKLDLKQLKATAEEFANRQKAT
jgi:acyl-[acyl-carrier-protein]-phospholipid O-acyltransferase/long-chain-fatty-acid--[acyl-carrier-protein] ligase